METPPSKGHAVKLDKLWRKLPAHEYAALFPARPKALRRIAFGLRRLGAQDIDLGYDYQPRPSSGKAMGNRVFTINEYDLAEHCHVSRRTLQRYLPLFESYGVLEVKRWRYRRSNAPSPNSYRLFFGSIIPEDWAFGGGGYPISARDRHDKGKRDNPLRVCAGTWYFGAVPYLVEGKFLGQSPMDWVPAWPRTGSLMKAG